MRQVWKCDHCSSMNEAANAIEEHEAQCAFNPENRGCYTCNHKYDEGAPISGFSPACRIGQMDDGDTCINCPFWESQNAGIPDAEDTHGFNVAYRGQKPSEWDRSKYPAARA